jgi:type VI secretion system secreted protein VgrG
VTGVTDISNAPAVQAQVDLINAYNGLAGLPSTSVLTGVDLGGLTLTKGVYFFMSSAQLTGGLVLNAQGLANQFFVFQIGSTLTTASASSVTIINPGANDGVFWQVGSSATLGAGTSFLGNILALQSITLVTGANILCGRALAHNGAVTLDTNNIDSIGCANVSGEGGSGGLSGGGLVIGPGGMITPVPEPGTLLLVGCGLVCLIALKRL